MRNEWKLQDSLDQSTACIIVSLISMEKEMAAKLQFTRNLDCNFWDECKIVQHPARRQVFLGEWVYSYKSLSTYKMHRQI